MQKTLSTSNGSTGDMMNLLLPALAQEYTKTMGDGRRLEAEHVDFSQLESIFQSEEFHNSAIDMFNQMGEPAKKGPRYHEVIIEMAIDMPEDMQDDLMAVLNHGGLSSEQAELVALLLIHAPIEENPHLVNHLGIPENAVKEVAEGYGHGNLPLKFLGLDLEETGRRLQAAQTTGPSAQLYVMNLMNQILSSLTSDFQTALNQTGLLGLKQATDIKNMIVKIWSDNNRYIPQND